MRKRKAETLMEIVVAMTLFGIIMSGVFDFMANQTQAMSRQHDRKILLNGVQKYVYGGKWGDSEDKVLGLKFSYNANNNGGCIYVKDTVANKNVMELYIDPPQSTE